MGEVAFVTIGLLTMFLIFILVWAKQYRKAGPNEVMVIFGRKRRVRNMRTGKVKDVGFRFQKGGGAFVWPVLEEYKFLSLEPRGVSVSTAPKMTADSVLASVEGTARVAIMGDEESIGMAAQLFLDQSPSEFGELVGEILDRHVLGVIGLRNFDDHRNHPDQIFDTLEASSRDALSEMGLYLVSFQVRAFRRV